MSDVIGRKVLPKLRMDYPPIAQAKLDILALSSRDDLQTIHVFGSRDGPSQDIIEENYLRRAKYWQEYLAIIRKHGVEDEYLKKLDEQYRELSQKLREVRWEIAQLEQLRRERR